MADTKAHLTSLLGEAIVDAGEGPQLPCLPGTSPADLTGKKRFCSSLVGPVPKTWACSMRVETLWRSPLRVKTFPLFNLQAYCTQM